MPRLKALKFLNPIPPNSLGAYATRSHAIHLIPWLLPLIHLAALTSAIFHMLDKPFINYLPTVSSHRQKN